MGDDAIDQPDSSPHGDCCPDCGGDRLNPSVARYDPAKEAASCRIGIPSDSVSLPQLLALT